MDLATPIALNSEAIISFAGVMEKELDTGCHPSSSRRLNLDSENVANGLGRLVLSLVKLLHELLERQAIRRIEGGSLTDLQIERIGLTLMRQAEELGRLQRQFGLKDADLNMDLGPLGKLF